MTEIIDIFDLASGGDGVGRGEDGRIIFVPETAPGDRVSVNITKEKKSHRFAEVNEILKKGDGRIQPQCQYFGLCGGCDWQHLSRETQSNWKARIVQQSLKRIAGTKEDELPTIISSKESYGTRTRLRLQVGKDRKLGFYKRGSRELIEIETCPIASPILSEAIKILAPILHLFPWPLHELRLLVSSDNIVSASFHLSRKVPVVQKEIKNKLQYWSRELVGDSLPLQGLELWQGLSLISTLGNSAIVEGKASTIYRPGGFAQASWQGNSLLVDEVMRHTRSLDKPSILELYAGCGNFSLPLASNGAKVLALDSNLYALKDGEKAAHQQDLRDKLSFQAFDDQRDSLSSLVQRENFKVDFLLLDPPRRGLESKLRQEIIDIHPTQILYVSCDPATLARDLQAFLDASYSVASIKAIDLMPHTSHVETVVLLNQS